MNLLGHALGAVRRGFFIFPCEPNGKTPARLYPNRDAKEAPWLIKWGDAATNDTGQVIRWWNECPERNIGVACKQSGLLVVDCDFKEGEYEGWDEWVDIASRHDPALSWTQTLIVRTGGGGSHLYYRWPSGVQASQSGLSDHVDIRSNGGTKGGYVLAPGSVTSKGPYSIEDDLPIAPAPPWLVELCRERPRPKFERPRFAQPGRITSYTGLERAVATAVEGDRNQCLVWAARSMCEDGADVEEAVSLLVPAAMTAGLPRREAEATVRSGYRVQQGKA